MILNFYLKLFFKSLIFFQNNLFRKFSILFEFFTQIPQINVFALFSFVNTNFWLQQRGQHWRPGRVFRSVPQDAKRPFASATCIQLLGPLCWLTFSQQSPSYRLGCAGTQVSLIFCFNKQENFKENYATFRNQTNMAK